MRDSEIGSGQAYFYGRVDAERSTAAAPLILVLGKVGAEQAVGILRQFLILLGKVFARLNAYPARDIPDGANGHVPIQMPSHAASTNRTTRGSITYLNHCAVPRSPI